MKRIAPLMMLLASCDRAPLAESPAYVPKSDEVVLEKLASAPGDPEARRLRELKQKVAADPHDLESALALARGYIEAGRARSDPRYNGWAMAVLQPWLSVAQPPPEALVLRATVLQSGHDFEGALADLDRVLRAAPKDPQAWITRAIILSVKGRFAQARESCRPLSMLSTDLVAAICEAHVDGLTGRARKAASLLLRRLDEAQAPTAGEQLWALTELAEIAARIAQDADAESYFKRALAVDPRDAYLLAAYADFLLDRDRAPEVIRLLEGRLEVDGLLLRLVLAEKAARSGGDHAKLLASRFEASRMRGDSVHRREEAMWALHVKGDAAEALRLAKENWNVQHEPLDVRIYLEAAREAEAAEPVLAFLDETKLEDARILALASKLRGAR
jgi:Tfp pilus assembly protein PilF